VYVVQASYRRPEFIRLNPGGGVASRLPRVRAVPRGGKDGVNRVGGIAEGGVVDRELARGDGVDLTAGGREGGGGGRKVGRER